MNYQLAHWNRQHARGIVFDSSAGFTLSTGAMLSPAASWMAQARWDALSTNDRRGFARICPDFVAKLLSLPTASPTPCARWSSGWKPAPA